MDRLALHLKNAFSARLASKNDDILRKTIIFALRVEKRVILFPWIHLREN